MNGSKQVLIFGLTGNVGGAVARELLGRGWQVRTATRDQESLGGCQTIFKSTTGRKPFGLPIPLALFNKMVGSAIVIMWRWMVDWLEGDGGKDLEAMINPARQACPDLHSVEGWLKLSSNGHNGSGEG